MKKVYITSHDRFAAQLVARVFEQVTEEFQVVSTWHNHGRVPFDKANDEQMRDSANLNFSEIDAADIVILVSGSATTVAGKYLEFGYALGAKKQCVLYGRPDSIPLWSTKLHRCDDGPNLLAHLTGRPYNG